MTGVVLKFDRSFKAEVRKKIERHLFDVGVLENRPHRAPAPGALKTLAGGPARRASGRVAGTTASVAKFVQARLHTDIFRRAIRKPKNRDIARFATAFFKTALRGENPNRAVNLMQAIVRNPILRGDYGRNSASAAKSKGFSRLFIDTGQLFRAIRARTKVKNVP